MSYASENEAPTAALDRVELDICAGEVIGVMGESGSGKSTLAASLIRLLPPRARVEGEIWFEGSDLHEMTEGELCRIRGSKIALIPQDPALWLNPVIRVGDQIGEALRAHCDLNRRERKSRTKELLREVRFDNPERIYSSYPHQLSGGERQRVVIAQGMACGPKLVIADEPTSKLDAAVQAEVLDLLMRMVRQEGTALVLITHDPAILAGIAQRIAVIYAGRIVECAPSEEIFRSPLHPYTKALVELVSASFDTPGKARMHLPSIPGEPPRLSGTGQGCRFEPRCPARMDVCLSHTPDSYMPAPSRRVDCFLYAERC